MKALRLIVVIILLLPTYSFAKMAKDDLDKAQEIFERLVKITPDDPDIYRYLGDIHSTKNNAKEAKKYYLQYAEMRPDDYYPYYRIGDLERYTRTKRAREYFEKGLNLIPPKEKETEALVAKARMLAFTKEQKESDEIFHKLLKQNPNDIDLINAYVETLADTKRYDEALVEVNEHLKQYPSDYALRRSKARILAAEHEYGEAKRILQRLRKEYPDDKGVKSDYAYMLMDMQDYYLAGPIFEDLVDEFPDDRDLFATHEEIYKQHRPRLLGGFGYRFTGDEQHFGPFLEYIYPLNSWFTYRARYFFNRNTANITGVAPNFVRYTNVVDILLDFKPLYNLTLTAGLSNQLDGSAYVPAPLIMIDYWEPWRIGRITLDFIYNRLLDDPTRGLFYDGKTDKLLLTYEKLLFDRLILTGYYGSNWYRVNGSKMTPGGGNDFGREDLFGAGFQVYVIRIPEIRLGYQFGYSKLHMVNNYLNEIPLIEESQRNAITFGFFHEFNEWYALDLSGFVGGDSKRNIGFGYLYGFRVGNTVKVSKHFTFTAGYEYSSESLQSNIGRYQFADFGFMYAF